MSITPRRWVQAQIGSICELVNGRAFKPSDWSQAGLPIVRIQNLNNAGASFNFCDFEVDSRFHIDSGELLFAWSGTPGTSFGAHVWRGGPAVLNQHIFRVIFENRVLERDFLAHAINIKLDELIGKAHGGVGLRHVTKGKFEETEIAIPPLAEQRRIVAKLDALDASSKRARADLDRIPALVARAKQSILEGFFAGDYASAAWGLKRVDEIADVSLGRQRSPDHHSGPNMRPYVRAANITWLGIDISDIKEMNFDEADFERFSLRPGDVLLNEGSGSAAEVGKPAIWRGELENCCFQNTVLRVRPVLCTSEFLYFVFLWAALSGQFIRKTQGVNIFHIGKAGLAKFEIPVPPVCQQSGIVHRIESAFAKIDRIAAEAASASKLLDRLDQALLSKAFRGELVPQDPDDEPASELLARIQSARAAAPKAMRTRKTRTPAS